LKKKITTVDKKVTMSVRLIELNLKVGMEKENGRKENWNGKNWNIREVGKVDIGFFIKKCITDGFAKRVNF
jgi:hypothetical protein